ncbi:MAG TPA: hypothetical protein PLY88_02360 [Candidatus Omnitrophota bacterium]|nr:hypothetical protein [Candidatus Omnitrophota bacterium]
MSALPPGAVSGMTLKRYLIAFVFPAAMILMAAFWCGAQSNFIFALTGFLACFLIAVTLLVEGWKKYNAKNPDKDA